MDERIEAQRVILKEGVNLEKKVAELEELTSTLQERIKKLEESEQSE